MVVMVLAIRCLSCWCLVAEYSSHRSVDFNKAERLDAGQYSVIKHLTSQSLFGTSGGYTCQCAYRVPRFIYSYTCFDFSIGDWFDLLYFDSDNRWILF